MPREPKEKPFLDDPAAYPEFSLLITRHWVPHAARWALHRRRYVLSVQETRAHHGWLFSVPPRQPCSVRLASSLLPRAVAVIHRMEPYHSAINAA